MRLETDSCTMTHKHKIPVVLSAIAALLIATAAVAAPKLTISPQQATVGDPIELQLVVPGAPFAEVLWPDIENHIGKFHLLSADTADAKTEKELGGSAITWKIAAFETGELAVGPIPVQVGKSSYTLDSTVVSIQTVLTDSTKTQFMPLKAQENLPLTFGDILRYSAPWLGGLAAIALIWWFVRTLLRRRKKGTEEAPEAPPVPPYDEALAALARLKRDNPLANGDIKRYVSELTLISKRLLGRVYEANVLEMTTGEFRRWSRSTSLRTNLNKLIRLFEASDFVKFAKGTLDATSCEKLMAATEEVVAAYKPRPEDLAETDENSEADKPDSEGGAV